MGKSRSTMLVTVCAQIDLLLLEHTHAVEHATDATVNNSLVEVTPLFDKSLFQLSDGQRLESGYGTRVLRAHPDFVVDRIQVL